MRYNFVVFIGKRYRAIVCAVVALCSVAPCAHAWTDKDYERFNYQRFANLVAPRARIDMKKIDTPLLNAALFYETNRLRVEHGRAPLKHSPALERAAQGHCEDMAHLGFFSHESPVGGKKTFDERIAREGKAVRAGSLGENIGRVFGIEYKGGRKVYPPMEEGEPFRYRAGGEPIQNRTYIGLAQEALKEWMNSSGHRKNILDRGFTELGTGSAHFNDSEYYDIDSFFVTQDFAGETAPAGKKR